MLRSTSSLRRALATCTTPEAATASLSRIRPLKRPKTISRKMLPSVISRLGPPASVILKLPAIVVSPKSCRSRKRKEPPGESEPDPSIEARRTPG